MGRSTIALFALLTAAVLLNGCGDGPRGAEHLRRAVLQGVGRDYLSGTQVGPPSFGLCLQRGLRRRLDARTLRALALTYRRPYGQQLTAQALNRLAVPVGDRCGGRRFVPELIEASKAFRAGRLPPAWRRSDARLVPRLIMPREVVSVGTFPMPVGGGGDCGREPVAAIRRMGPGDALVSIQEYEVTARLRRRLTRNFPPRSAGLDLQGLRFSRVAASVTARGVPVIHTTIPFSEAGRAFDALVYFGGRPSADLREAAARVLAGLDFQ